MSDREIILIGDKSFTVDWRLVAVVKEIIQAETERCAKIAETWAKEIPDADQGVFAELAQKIRKGD